MYVHKYNIKNNYENYTSKNFKNFKNTPSNKIKQKIKK